VDKVKLALNYAEQRKNKIIEIQRHNRLLLLNESNSFKRRVQQSNNIFDQLVQIILKSAFTGSLTSGYRARNDGKYKSSEKFEYNKASYREISHIIAKKGKPHFIPDEWKWTNINSVATFIGSGITPRGGKAVYVKSGIPFIRSQNVHSHGLRLDDIVFVAQDLHAKMQRTHIKGGDVLLNITGASIGRTTFIPNDFGPANVNQHVCIIRTDGLINPEFLSWWLNSSYIQDMIMDLQKGETREGLNYTHIRSLPIPYTIIEEQDEIVRLIRRRLVTIAKIKNQIVKITETYVNIEKYFNSLPISILREHFSVGR
jgi:type I restriction enzyme S subunit